MTPTRMRTQRARAFAAVLVVCMTIPCWASARVLTVDCAGSAEYETIQDAVDASAAGDTISVAPCVYEEQVVIPDREITIAGAGSDVTEITWSDVMGAIRYSSSPLTLQDLTVRGTSSGAQAIMGQQAPLRMYDCVVAGRMWGVGEVDIRRCSVTHLESTAGMRTSTVEDSRFGSASFWPFWQSYHNLESAGSRYGVVVTGTSGHCVGDSIGYVELWGGPEAYQSLVAESCVIDSCYADAGAVLELADCTIGDIVYVFEMFYYYPWIRMSGCLITGEVVVSEGWWGRAAAASGSGVRDAQEPPFIEHNTLLRGLRFDVEDLFDGFYIRSNLVMGETLIESVDGMVVSHNNFAGGLDLSAPAAQVFENIDADPQFCDPLEDDYSVHSTSPCVGAAHDGGVIGAFGVGCGTAVELTSWGAIKALYR